MSCEGLKGDALKKCQEKNKARPNQQKEENKYEKGSAKVSLADLNEITFKNAHGCSSESCIEIKMTKKDQAVIVQKAEKTL